MIFKYVAFIVIISLFLIIPSITIPAVQYSLGYEYFLKNHTYKVQETFNITENHLIVVEAAYESKYPIKAKGNDVLECYEEEYGRFITQSWEFSEWSYKARKTYEWGGFKLPVTQSAIDKVCRWRFEVWLTLDKTELHKQHFTNNFTVVS